MEYGAYERTDTPRPLQGRVLLLEAIDEVRDDLSTNGGAADWANPPSAPADLDSFLEAFGALLYSMEHVYENSGQAVPEDPWVILARVMRGARYYE